MSVTPDKLGIYNRALSILKERRLSALTDDVEKRYALDDQYDHAIAWCLEQGLWNFASRAVELYASEDVEASWGFAKAFDIPTDFVRLAKISRNPDLYPTMSDLEYIFEQSYIVAHGDPIYIQYISDDESYGKDLSLWPESFQRFVEHELAYRISGHIGSFSAGELDRFEGMRDRAMKDARSKDAMNQGYMRPPPGRLTTSRGTFGARGGNAGRPWWRF